MHLRFSLLEVAVRVLPLGNRQHFFALWEPPQHIHEPLFAMFGILQNHGVAFAVAAIILAIVSTMYRPRWIGLTALVLAGWLFFDTVFVVQ